jgi:hypothetical protein
VKSIEINFISFKDPFATCLESMNGTKFFAEVADI